MAEVTRVPLQPIAKGSMMKFWLGLLVGIALSAGVAWFTSRPASVSIETITAGEGESPSESDVVFVHYTGKLEDGTVFDQSQDAAWPIEGILPNGAPLPLDRMIPGFKQALMQMQKGGSYTVDIPSELGYGATPPPGSPIPADADLVFDIQLVDFMSNEEAEQRYQAMLQALEQQQPAEGEAAAAGAAPSVAPAQ